MRSPYLILFPALLAASAPAYSQSLGEVEQRIDHLEQSVRQLVRQRTEADPYRDVIRNQASALLTLDAKFAALEKSLAKLVAAEEQDRRAITSMLDQIQRSKGDVEARLEVLEKPQPVTPSAPVPPPVAVKQVVRPLTADERFSEARRFADDRDWVKAEFAFDTFLNSYPEDGHVPEATFWLGRSYQGQGKAAQAARLYLELYKKYPKADFALDNLFALAKSLMDLGPENVVQACSVYSEISAVFNDRLVKDQRQILLDERLALKCDK